MDRWPNEGKRATGTTVLSIPQYMRLVSEDTPKLPHETEKQYKERLYQTAQLLYAEDWLAVQGKPAPIPDVLARVREDDRAYTRAHQAPVQRVQSVHEELGNQRNIKLKRIRER